MKRHQYKISLSNVVPRVCILCRKTSDAVCQPHAQYNDVRVADAGIAAAATSPHIEITVSLRKKICCSTTRRLVDDDAFQVQKRT